MLLQGEGALICSACVEFAVQFVEEVRAERFADTEYRSWFIDDEPVAG
jgi:hypothetical protein